jgi:hypothetical protein
MKRSLAIGLAAAGLALFAFAPTEASAGGRYHGYGYGYGYGCCCPSYCCGWVRGRGFNRPYAHYGYYGYRHRGLRRAAYRHW